jgi:hypothetical protein
MRVAIEQALFAQRALEAAGSSLSPAAPMAIDRAVSLLTRVIDGTTGYVPNHGANDGGRVAPVSTAEYRDFRPLLTLAAIVRGTPIPHDIAPDPEILSWFGFSEAPRSRAPRRRRNRSIGMDRRADGRNVRLHASRQVHASALAS